MDDWIDIQKDDKHVARERKKAKELRQTKWWREQLDKGLCHYCGEHFTPDELTMDHVVPLSRGGRSVKGNVVACCQVCNQEKKYLTPVDMILKELDIPKDDGEGEPLSDEL